MCVKHNYTPDGSYIFTAMFIPCHRNVINKSADIIDSRGWCDPEASKQYFEVAREKLAANPKSLLIYKAEYCFTIEEALLQQGDNMFPRELLAEQQSALEIYKTIPAPEVGTLLWNIGSDDKYCGVR
jgi:hypothetical protein